MVNPDQVSAQQRLLLPSGTLQQDWKTYGKDNFAIEVLDTLEYSKDESKTDYSEDLAERGQSGKRS